MRAIKVCFIALLFPLLLAGCMGNIAKQANREFGDQHFKTAIALIELYKTRFGEYPATLDSLKYLGDWDRMIWNSVKYQRLDTGYELDLINGWVGRPDTLIYPDEFWQGLGLVKSNLKK